MGRPAWRRGWFQVHKWIGLILAVAIIPIALTGAVLVWHDALDRAVNAQRFAVTGAAVLSPDAYLAAARVRLAPGDRVAQITLPDDGGPATVAAAPAPQPGSGGPAARRIVYLDPPTARVLDVASSDGGLVRFLHVLHGRLQIPGPWGRTIVGWIGVAMMISAFTGLWLWWPMVGRWTRGLRWRRHEHVETNLHHLVGFWIALPLFVLSLTGAWISFPAFFGALSGEARAPGPDRAALARARPLATPAQSLDAVIVRAAAMSRGATLRSIAWPTDRTPDWTIAYADGRSVKVADDTGRPTAAAARPQPGVARLMRRIHDGTGMGPVWRTIIFLGGIAPAVLAITGIVMWWRARGWRRARAGRRTRPT